MTDAATAAHSTQAGRHSAEFEALLDRLRAAPFQADTTPVDELRAGFERFAALLADPPAVDLESVDAGGVPGEWARSADADRSSAVLYLHGGGYTLGSVASYRDMSARLAVESGVPVLTVEYRLAPEHPFPAALDDALAAYAWLCEDLDPHRIVLAGDSAGGGLAVATALAARDRGRPLPGGLVLVSPKVDLSQSGSSLVRNADVDPVVSPGGTRAHAERYLGPHGDPRDPLASPVYADLSGLPPMYVYVGTAEVLLDDALVLARRAREAGTEVDLDVWPDMIHILPFFASSVPEARLALATMAGHVRRRSRA